MPLTSAGGAGFLYPQQRPNGTGLTYAKGDRVRTELLMTENGKGEAQKAGTHTVRGGEREGGSGMPRGVAALSGFQSFGGN